MWHPEIALPVAGGVLAAQAATFARWLLRRWRDDQVHRVFVADMAINHLPHIYSALRNIAGALDIELKEQPPICWVAFPDEAKDAKR